MKKKVTCFKCGKEGEPFNPYLKKEWNNRAILSYCFYYDWKVEKHDPICIVCFNALTNKELLSCSMTNWADFPPFKKTFRKWRPLVIEKIRKSNAKNYYQVCRGGPHCCAGPCCVLFPEYVKSSDDCKDFQEEKGGWKDE